MKVFTNKSIIRKIAIVFVIITIFGFCFSSNVQADSSVGGKLLKPVIDLVLSLGDGTFNIVHRIVLNQNDTLLPISLGSTTWEKISTALVFIGVAIAAAAAVIVTAGIAAAVIGAIAGVTLSAVSVGTVLLVSVTAGTVGAAVYNSNAFPKDKLDLPLYSISPEDIFKNELALLDVDFFSPQQTKILYDDGKVEYTNNTNKQSIKDALAQGKAVKYESTAKQLRGTISAWFRILRNISLVLLLSILVYIGIRILISSTSNDKAKYKQFLMDWVVAICLLFLMQYIMSFSNFFVKKITEVVSNINYNNATVQIIEDKDGKISKTLKEDYGYTDDKLKDMYVKDDKGNYKKNGDNKYIYWSTNLIGIARLNAQMEQDKSATYAGYTIIFLTMVFYTIFFIWTYLKRVVYMAFLTLISPLVALTYPIDKMNDGKAQAFNMWFKEYIFNLLIQPMHLILYTVLVSTAFELATQNMLYTLVALGFMVPAEKLLRKFFGFEKASTPGMFAGPAGAAAAMGMVHKLFGKAPRGAGKGLNKGGTSSEGVDDKPNIKYKKTDNSALYGGESLDNIQENATEKINFGANNDSGNSKSTMENNNRNNNQPIQDRNQVNNEFSNNEDRGYIEDWAGEKASQVKDWAGGKASNAKEWLGNTRPAQFAKSKANAMANSSGVKKLRKIKNKIPKSRTLNAGKAAARYYANGMKNKIKNKAKNSLTMRNLATKTAGLALGATAATVGVAAGIASGDPTKAMQYSAGAAIGGYKFGNSATNSVANAIGVEGAVDYAKKSYYGEDGWNEKQIRDNTKAFQNKFENKEYLRNKIDDKEKRKEFMNNVVPEYYSHGITDIKDIYAGYQLENASSYNVTREQAISAVMAQKAYGKDTTDLSAKEDKEFNDTLLMRSKGNYEYANGARNLIDAVSAVRNDKKIPERTVKIQRPQPQSQPKPNSKKDEK